MKLTLLLMLLLCSCATQRQAEKYFDENTDKLAEYIDKNTAYTQEYGEAYAAKYFPPKLYPPAIEPQSSLMPSRLNPSPIPEIRAGEVPYAGAVKCPECKGTHTTEVIYLEDTAMVDALRLELNQERKATGVIRQQLKHTAAERDYWQEMNRKKFWALIAMLVFALLYLLFKILSARIRGA